MVTADRAASEEPALNDSLVVDLGRAMQKMQTE
jgi:hypothetical protein